MTRMNRVVTALMVLGFGPAFGAAAQDTSHIEPDAMAALQRMGGYLRSLKAFQVDAITSTEQRSKTARRSSSTA